MDVIRKVRDFVEMECKRPSSKYGFEVYNHHFVSMVSYALKLAKKFKADVEIVEISAWLHDIGSIVYGRENHHVTGAKIAEKFLEKLRYPKERIELVKKCIFNLGVRIILSVSLLRSRLLLRRM